jgi:hypothetical protein
MTYRSLVFTLPLYIPLALAPACGGDDEKIDADAAVEPTPDSAPQPQIDAATPTADAGPGPDATPCVNIVGQTRNHEDGVEFDLLDPTPDVAVTAWVDGLVVATDTTEPVEGGWGVCVPAGSDVAISFEKDLYANLMLLRVADQDQYIAIRMFTEDFVDGYWIALGATYPSDTSGFISINVVNGQGIALSEVMGSIDPASGDVHYVAPDFSPDPSATSTSSAGFFVFYNVDEGAVDLTLDHPTLTCRHEDDGFSAGTPEVLRIPVKNDVETAVNVVCE